jgi:hypothetical protein
MKEQVGLVQSAAITHGIDAGSGPASWLYPNGPYIAAELRKRGRLIIPLHGNLKARVDKLF